MSNLLPDELRILTVYAPVLLKILRHRETRILSQLYGEFRAGKLDPMLQTARLAEFCSIRDQINEITNAARLHEQGDASGT